jgi:hypothetical protein
MVLSVPGTPVVNVEATDTLTHEEVPPPTGWGVLVLFPVINANPTVSKLPWGLTTLVDLASQTPTVTVYVGAKPTDLLAKPGRGPGRRKEDYPRADGAVFGLRLRPRRVPDRHLG